MIVVNVLNMRLSRNFNLQKTQSAKLNKAQCSKTRNAYICVCVCTYTLYIIFRNQSCNSLNF